MYTITHNNLPDLHEYIKQVNKYINQLGSSEGEGAAGLHGDGRL